MKRGFLGTTEVDTINYWTDGKSSQQLKCNETNLYALIDLCQESVEVAETVSERQLQYSLMDKYFLCLQAIDLAGADDDALRTYGQIIANMEDRGSFKIQFDTLEEENRYVDSLVEELMEGVAEETFNLEFMKWYEEVVVSYNYYQNLDGSRTKSAPRLGRLGAIYSDDYYSKKAKESGMALLYVACNKGDVLDGCVDKNEMQNKLLYQGQTYNWLASCGTNMTKISVMANIKAGIKANTGLSSADEALDAFKAESIEEGNKKGMGELVMLIITLVLTAVSIIVKLITEILKTRQAEASARMAQAEAEAISPDLAEYAAPAYRDYSDKIAEMDEMLMDANKMSALDFLPIVGMGAVAIIALLLSKKRREQ